MYFNKNTNNLKNINRYSLTTQDSNNNVRNLLLFLCGSSLSQWQRPRAAGEERWRQQKARQKTIISLFKNNFKQVTSHTIIQNRYHNSLKLKF